MADSSTTAPTYDDDGRHVVVRASGPGVYEDDRLLLAAHDYKNVVVIMRGDLDWLEDAIREYRKCVSAEDFDV